MDKLIDSFSKFRITKEVITIQRYYRGYRTRKKLATRKDNFTYKDVYRLLNYYIQYCKKIIHINRKLRKKIRLPNFPSEISENIVKFILYHKRKIMPEWCRTGDLILMGKKLEIKAYISKGPSSFDPTEKWYRLYFLDCSNFMTKHFICYEILLTNKDTIWKHLKVNKHQTYHEQCIQKRRPRFHLNYILPQLHSRYYRKIFDSTLSSLSPETTTQE